MDITVDYGHAYLTSRGGVTTITLEPQLEELADNDHERFILAHEIALTRTRWGIPTDDAQRRGYKF